ncbi:MAG TPA: CrcB family protein [Planctomycetota bacterium]|nr:CrcB family protein [Planctomycetota bacterium]
MQATLLVSLAAAGGFGLCWSLGQARWSPQVATVVLVGFFGSFTTFSSFAFDCSSLWEERRYGVLAADVLGHNLLGLLAMWAGIAAGRGASRG